MDSDSGVGSLDALLDVFRDMLDVRVTSVGFADDTGLQLGVGELHTLPGGQPDVPAGVLWFGVPGRPGTVPQWRLSTEAALWSLSGPDGLLVFRSSLTATRRSQAAVDALRCLPGLAVTEVRLPAGDGSLEVGLAGGWTVRLLGADSSTDQAWSLETPGGELLVCEAGAVYDDDRLVCDLPGFDFPVTLTEAR